MEGKPTLTITLLDQGRSTLNSEKITGQQTNGASRDAPNTKWKRRGLSCLKHSGISILFFSLFVLSLSGFTEIVVGGIVGLDSISQSNEEFLKRSLYSALGHFSALSVVKAGLAAISGSAPFGIAIGKIVSPMGETVNFIWKVFGYSMVSITGQMAILDFFRLISLKVCFSIGALIYAISLNRGECLKRWGKAFMLIGLILYFVMPLSIYTGQIMFEETAQTANEELSLNIEDFKTKMDEVKIFSIGNLKPKNALKTVTKLGDALDKGLDVLIGSLVGYFSNLMIMFVVTPLFFYGVIYLMIKWSLDWIGLGEIRVRLDTRLLGMMLKRINGNARM